MQNIQTNQSPPPPIPLGKRNEDSLVECGACTKHEADKSYRKRKERREKEKNKKSLKKQKKH